MNKYRMTAVLLSAALALSLTACSNSDNDTSADSTASSGAQSQFAEHSSADFDNVDLMTLCEANSMENLANVSSKITATMSYVNPDGSSGGSYQEVYTSGEAGVMCLYEGDNDTYTVTVVDLNGCRYEEQVYPDGSKKYYVTPTENIDPDSFIIGYDETEKVIERVYDAGTNLLTVVTEVEGANSTLSDFFGVQIASQQYEYIVDADTLVMQKMNHYAVQEGGSRHLYKSCTNVFETLDAQTVPQFVLDAQKSVEDGKVRTVTVNYVSSGETASFTIPNYSLTNIDLYLNLSGSYGLYADEECTKTYEGVVKNADGTYPDMNVYVK